MVLSELCFIATITTRKETDCPTHPFYFYMYVGILLSSFHLHKERVTHPFFAASFAIKIGWCRLHLEHGDEVASDHIKIYMQAFLAKKVKWGGNLSREGAFFRILA